MYSVKGSFHTKHSKSQELIVGGIEQQLCIRLSAARLLLSRSMIYFLSRRFLLSDNFCWRGENVDGCFNLSVSAECAITPKAYLACPALCSGERLARWHAWIDCCRVSYEIRFSPSAMTELVDTRNSSRDRGATRCAFRVLVLEALDACCATLNSFVQVLLVSQFCDEYHNNIRCY